MWAYRAALFLLPRDFREQYRDEMLRAYARELGASRSPLARAAFRLRVFWDLVLTAVRLRVRPPPRSNAVVKGRKGMRGSARWGYDLRMALRTLRRSPGFTMMAIVTLALGLGANAAIFGAVKAVILAPFPYGDEDGLVMVWSQWINFPKTWVSTQEYQNYTRRARTLDDVAAFTGESATFTSPDNPERVQATAATANLFRTLRVEPEMGRSFTDDEARGGANVALIGYRLWQRRYGGSSDIVGRNVEIDGVATRVLGVLPRGFMLPTDYQGTTETELFRPLWIDTSADVQVPANGGGHGLYVVGRMAPDASAAGAQTDLSRLVDDLTREGVYPPEWGFRVRVIPLGDDVLGTSRRALWVLMGAVALVLLIACGNVGSLLLARGRTRAREMAVRSAMGAGREVIVRQILLESLLLAVGGGAVGVVLGMLGVRGLLSLDPGAVPRSGTVGLDAGVLAFTLAVATATAILFGLVPALRAAGQADLAGALREGRRNTGRGGRRAHGLMVAGQTALAVMLLVGAGLMLRTFQRLSAVDPGFDTDGALTLRLSLPAARYPDVASASAFYDRVLSETRSLPGVTDAAFVRVLPLATQIGDWGLQVDGYTPPPGQGTPGDWQVVSEGYFRTMDIPVVRGRTFDATDDVTGDGLVINETMARRYWEGRDPLGTLVVAMGDTTVVMGVVGDVTHNGITAEIKPKFYRLQRQIPDGLANTQRGMTLVVRAGTAGDPYQVLAPVRDIIRRADPSLAVSEVQTLDEVTAGTLGQPQMLVTLLGLFAATALLLSVVGVYGVLAYAVTRRTREIGVRMALGADRRGVVGMVVRQGMGMASLGLVVGLGGALVLTRTMRGLLYGVAPQDPATFAVVSGLFLIVTFTAAYLPARRAARTDPVGALRTD